MNNTVVPWRVGLEQLRLDVASSYMSVAEVYKKKGQVAESLRYLEQSHSIFASQSM
jgi:hypothetical protein